MAGGQTVAALTYLGLIPFWKMIDKRGSRNLLCGPAHPFHSGGGVAVADIVCNGTGEQMRRLQYISQVRLQKGLGMGADIHPV